MPNYKEKKKMLRELVKQEQQERISQIQQKGHEFIDSDAFKRSQKFYKYYVHRKTDYSKVMSEEQMKKIDVEGKQVFEIAPDFGAFIVKNFCSKQMQMQIGFQALNNYIKPPYRTNLDGTNGLYHEGKKQEQEKQEQQPSEKQEAVVDEVKNQDGQTLYFFNQKIRMANLGYQYDWPKRSYPSTKVPVPQTIQLLTKGAVNLFNSLTHTELEYQGEAIIVNYYKGKDYMTGHLDDGEIDQKNPIFSFSFGLSCIFLIGETTREKQPLAVRLDSGDLLIMSGHSRICYHGVPRVIEDSYSHNLSEEKEEEKEEYQIKKDKHVKNGRKEVENYLKTHRLNINIRQVYPNDEKGDDKSEDKEECEYKDMVKDIEKDIVKSKDKEK